MRTNRLAAIDGLFHRLEAPFDRTLYLPVFRVYLAWHIAKKIALEWPYLRLLYANDSFVATGTFLARLGLPEALHRHYLTVIVLYLAATLGMALGIGRRLTIGAVFLLTVVVQQMEPYTLNGGDNLLKFALLYLCLCDSFAFLSLQPGRATAEWRRNLDRALTRIGVLLILGHLALIYAVSAFGKIHAQVWYDGVANYYIASLERFNGPGSHFVVRSAPVVVGTTYLTVFWEATFPFFMWNRRLRWFSAGLGVAIHGAIAVMMMLYDFELLFIACYGFLLTDDEWRRIWKFVRAAFARWPRIAALSSS